MKYVTLKVTQKHIDEAGRPAAGWKCPLELAATDAGFPDAVVTTVGSYGWYPELRDTWPIPLTRKAKAFIDRFDSDLPVKPDTFRLRVE